MTYLADNMGFIGVTVLLPFVLSVAKSAGCNYDDIFVVSGRNVSLEWTLRNISNETMDFVSAKMLTSSENIIAELVDWECIVYLNDSLADCKLHHTDDKWILSLTLFNVTAKQSGNYTLLQFQGIDEKDISSKTLVVIEKPIIMEVCTPFLHQSFQLTCDTPHGLKCIIFRWKINGTGTEHSSNVNTLHVSRLRMTDNFSQISCQVCLNETRSSLSSEISEHSCSIESDVYRIEVTYGPDNISLSVKESHFYLKEHELFTIDCFANCSPKCKFWWKGRDITEGEKLVITSFEPRMAGEYTCYVTNQRTNITTKSDSIILHHAKENDYWYNNMIQTATVTLLSRENEGLQSVQYWMGPVIVSVFLLVVGLLILIRHWRKRQTRKRQFKLSAKLKRNNRVANDDRIPAPEYKDQNNPLQEDFTQENPYSTIDDDNLSIYNHGGIGNVIEKNSHQTGMKTEHAIYDYARCTEMCQAETVDVHVTDETYITPMSDLTHSFTICQDEEFVMLKTDHTYLALIDDLENLIESVVLKKLT